VEGKKIVVLKEGTKGGKKTRLLPWEDRSRVLLLLKNFLQKEVYRN